MSDSKTESRLGALLLRRLYSLVRSGVSLDDAGKRLRDASSPTMAARIDLLVARLKEPGATAQTGHEVIIREAQANGADSLASSVRFSTLADDFAASLQRMMDGLDSRTGIFIGTAVVAMLITLMMQFWVVPFFAELYSYGSSESLTSALPYLTRLVFEMGGGVVAVMMVIALGLAAWGTALIKSDLRQALQKLKPMSGRWRIFPVTRRLVDRVNHFIMIVVAESMRAGGMDLSRAVEVGARIAGVALPAAAAIDERRSPPELVALAMARDSGDFGSEFAWQVGNLESLLQADFEAVVSALMAVLTALVALVVGVLVVAVYLPIFRMGSVAF